MSRSRYNSNALEIPASYDQINLYNSDFSPSTVHVKNAQLTRFFRKYLLQKAISVFKFTLPEEWDADYFKYTLYGMGYIAVLETRSYGVICQGGALGGYNLYYRPAYIIITNPLIKGSIQADIGTECEIIKLQPDYSGIMDIVSYYADQMALASEAMGINLVNVKTGIVFGAESDRAAQSYKKMYDKLSAGDPAIVIGKDLLNEKGEPTWFPFTQHIKESYVVSDLLADMRKIEDMFDTEIGLPNANTGASKRERMIVDEVNANNVETASRCELWLESIKSGMEKANAMFGLSLEVDWRVKPDTQPAEPAQNEMEV